MTAIAAPPSTKLLLSTGKSLEVAGAPDRVGKLLEDAVRGGPGTLAWLQDADSDEAVGVNPAHVVAVTLA